MFLPTDRQFGGPHHAPTVERQYVLKDVILVTAALVIVAGTFRGGRLIRGDLVPGKRLREGGPLAPEQKLGIVLGGHQRREPRQRPMRAQAHLRGVGL